MSFYMVRQLSRLMKSMVLRSQVTLEQRTYLHCYRCNHQTNPIQLVSNNVIHRLLRIPENEIVVRYYAKGKDKKKEKGKGKVDERILTDVTDVEKMHEQFQRCIENLKEDYARNLSLRSTTGSIETLPVKFEGTEYKLQELAQIIRQNPKSIILNMSSFPQSIPAVLQAIDKSGMNLNPQQDGTKLFIPVPKVTKELRESLAKSAKAMFVKCRTNLKDVQNKIIKSVKNKEKTENLSVDDSRNAAEMVTVLCDQYVSQADKLFVSKQAELKGESN